MPIEIRELIIKTEISTGNKGRSEAVTEEDLNNIRVKLLEECKRMISAGYKRDRYKR